MLPYKLDRVKPFGIMTHEYEATSTLGLYDMYRGREAQKRGRVC